MSVDGRTTSPVAAPPLPTSIWVVAWASLAGQALVIAVQGLRSDDGVSPALSVVLDDLGQAALHLLAIAVLVGVLGGLVPPAGDGVDVRVDVVGP